MRAGDVLWVDLGTPMRGEPGFVRPVVVLTDDEMLQFGLSAINVVPCTARQRDWPSDVPTEWGVAQCHAPMTMNVERVIDPDRGNVGAVALAQIRENVGRVLGIV